MIKILFVHDDPLGFVRQDLSVQRERFVVSRNTAIPEVVGNAGVYIDEFSPEEVARKIKYALTFAESYGKRDRRRIVNQVPLNTINEIAKKKI